MNKIEVSVFSLLFRYLNKFSNFLSHLCVRYKRTILDICRLSGSLIELPLFKN
jgi:hypothetical protein